MYIIKEAKMLLTEDQESDSIRKAIALYMDIMGCSKEEANKFVREDLREKFPNLRYKKEGKFILGTTRMFLNRQFVNDNIRQAFNATLPYVASDANYQKYDKNLNGLSADEIIERFREERERDAANDREKLANQEYEKNNLYDIVRINTFEQSSQYAQYCYQRDIWCITKYPNMLDSYTDGGIGQFYFCLKKGFEDMEPIQGEGCPLDEYGLSMIAVCVNGDGSLKNCTCRWNHSNGGNDNIMNAEEVSNVLGVNFYDVFKPNGGLQEVIKDKIQRLKNGENINEVFDNVFEVCDGIYRVELKRFLNYINLETKEVISNKWFTYGSPYINGSLILVTYEGEDMYLDITNGETYGKDKVDKVIEKKIIDFLNSGGTISELKDAKITRSCYRTWNLPNAYQVCSINKYNILMSDNTFMFEKWYDRIDELKIDERLYFRIKENGQYFLLNEEKENILGTSYKYIGVSFLQGGTIEIIDEEGANIIKIDNPTVKLCKKSGAEHMDILIYSDNPENMLFKVQESDGLYYISDGKGDLKVNVGFEGIQSYISNNIVLCKNNNKYAVIYIDDFEMSEWYDKIQNLYYNKYDPYMHVYLNEKVTFLNGYTRKEFPQWFSEVEDLSLGEYIVYNEEQLCNLFRDGVLVLDKWVSKIERTAQYSSDFTITNTNGKKNILLYDGMSHTYSYTFEKWYDDVFYNNSTYEVTISENGNTFTCFVWDVKRNNL